MAQGGHMRPRYDGRYEIKITVDGKRYSVYGLSEEEANIKAAEKKRELGVYTETRNEYGEMAYVTRVGFKRLDTFVYFIRDGLKHIKIGIAYDTQSRMNALQTANPMKLKLFCQLKLPTRDDALNVEKELHKMFNDDRLEGEWFNEHEVLRYLMQDNITIGDWEFKGFNHLRHEVEI